MTTNPTNSTVLKLIIPLSLPHPNKVIKLYGVEGVQEDTHAHLLAAYYRTMLYTTVQLRAVQPRIFGCGLKD